MSLITSLLGWLTRHSAPLRPQSISTWVLRRMFFLLLAVNIAFLCGSIFVVKQRFDAFDVTQYQQDLERVAVSLENNKNNLATTLGDYAHWNDSYQFVQTRNNNYIESNFIRETLNNIDVNQIIIFDRNHDIITHLKRQEGEPQYPISTQYLARRIAAMDSGELSTPNEAQVELIWINKSPILVAIDRITDSQLTKPANGFLVFTRDIGADDIEKIRKITNVSFHLYPVEFFGPRAVNHKKNYLFNNDGIFNVTKRLAGMGSVISTSGPTRLEHERKVTTWIFVVNAILMDMIALVGIFLILNRRVLQRIETFSHLVDVHRQNQRTNIAWPVTGGDELDNLATALNEMMLETQIRHDELHHLSYHDTLTTIGNRRQLMMRLQGMTYILGNHRPDTISCLLMLDLDGFKPVNDGLGHRAGDRVLQLVAARITAVCRDVDLPVRLGGDEFALFLQDTNVHSATKIADRLHASFAEPFFTEGCLVTISASIGIAVLEHNMDADSLLRNADLAMYEAKSQGKGRTHIFSKDLLEAAARGLYLEQGLRRALSEDLIEVWYQPVVNVQTHSVTGMEALARWSFEDNLIPPHEFIHIAERSGLISRVGRAILNKACANLATLRLKHPNLTCSVNVSVRQFIDTNLSEDVSAALQLHKLPTDALYIELTESMLADHAIDIAPTMKTLVAKGICFHLDDFGIGYSSLDRLRSLPFDALKIDRSFVLQLRNGDDVMVRNIIRLSQELGMKVIGEGIENDKECRRLLELGCEHMQGFLFANPMPIDQLYLWLDKYKNSAS